MGEAVALGGLGRVEYSEGNVERGLELLEQSAELCRLAGFTFFEAQFLHLLASYAFELGRLDEALRHHCAALMLSRRTGERQLNGLLARTHRCIAAKRQEMTRAGRLWGAIEAEEARGPLGAWERQRDSSRRPCWRCPAQSSSVGASRAVV